MPEEEVAPGYLPHRVFYDVLFLGNGHDSGLGIQYLHARLETGLNIQSGLQQGAHCMDEGEIEKREEQLRDVVRDIAAALGFDDKKLILDWKTRDSRPEQVI